MYHPLCLRLMHGAQHEGQVGHIPTHHTHVVPRRGTEDVSQKLTIRHQVENGDLMSSFEQSTHGIGTNKASTAGHEITHGCPPCGLQRGRMGYEYCLSIVAAS